jgi:molybdate transport system substrate-binding protein
LAHGPIVMRFRYLPWVALLISLLVLGTLAAVWWPDRDTPVVVHVAAALRPAMETAAPEFEAQTGTHIELRYGASEGILTSLRVTGQGDLFLPADDSYATQARDAGLVGDLFPLATMTGVLVLRTDYPKSPSLFTWDDLFRPDFKLVQPDPDATAIGKVTRAGLTPTGHWARIEARKPPTMGTVTEAANAVKLGSADGAIIWDAVAASMPTLQVVRLPELDRVQANVSIAICTRARASDAARQFAEYLAGEAGQKHFRALGYAPPRRGPGA